MCIRDRAVMTGLLTCLAWKVSDEELAQRQAAESRLKGQNPRAFELRERMILEHGRPGSRCDNRCVVGIFILCSVDMYPGLEWGRSHQELALIVILLIVVNYVRRWTAALASRDLIQTKNIFKKRWDFRWDGREIRLQIAAASPGPNWALTF